ncbi:uncharacterized protein LOC111250754 [Varroa destructor]|uniref:INO80 complex subunit F domain-containing protein n=1 Tax=Varroa destructor TaxID=109461 RepID=A0A7M7KEE9_VARDE|nr:uncharacterized protein LOC111250754 [Varroa destructor]XP_022662182.1 uncharacterized protein LOC111250754 [Varroa destructor]XP_022662183.1 uncharacterized protein LOC111250754 [Varroa destructor]
MREEQQPVFASNMGSIAPPASAPGASVTSKFEELVQKCAQLESENAVLAYKLRRMRKTIRRLGQDNAFIQRRLREHIRKREGSTTTTLAALVATTTMGLSCEHGHTGVPTTIKMETPTQENQGAISAKSTNSAASRAAPTLSAPTPTSSTPVITATSNGHVGRTSNIKLEPPQANKKSGVSQNPVMTSIDVIGR